MFLLKNNLAENQAPPVIFSKMLLSCIILLENQPELL